MYFDQLSNEEWALLAPILSDKPAVRPNRRGRPRVDPRIVANAVLWILTTGEPWSSLPGRYPSGPTCRRRFEEWQVNGTLARIIRLLAHTGRMFAYIPNSSSAVTRSALRRGARIQCDDGLRSVLWKSPESWQVPPRKMDGRRSIDPFDEITRQLSGRVVDAPLCIESSAMTAASSSRPLNRPCGSPWTSTPSPAMQVAERRGYVIYADADPAQKYALDWACQWTDQQNPTQIAAQTAPAADVARPPIARPMPEPVMEDVYDETEHEDVSFGSSLNTAMVK